MLNFHAIGPDDKGHFLTVYDTPGCDVPTVACVCNALHLAEREAQRRNAEELAQGRTGSYIWLDEDE